MDERFAPLSAKLWLASLTAPFAIVAGAVLSNLSSHLIDSPYSTVAGVLVPAMAITRALRTSVRARAGILRIRNIFRTIEVETVAIRTMRTEPLLRSWGNAATLSIITVDSQTGSLRIRVLATLSFGSEDRAAEFEEVVARHTDRDL